MTRGRPGVRRSAAIALALLAAGLSPTPPARPAAAQDEAVVAAPPPRPSEQPVQSLQVRVAAGEPLKPSLLRIGVTVADANSAIFALSQVMDPLHVDRPLTLQLRLQSAGPLAPMVLVGLTVRGDRGADVGISRQSDGPFELKAPPPPDADLAEPPPPSADGPAASAKLVQGPMEDVLYGRGGAEAVPPLVLYRAVKLFAHKLDLSRDVSLGDRVRLIYGARVNDQGRVSTGGEDLLYAEIDGRGGATRFYQQPTRTGPRSDFLDDEGGDLHRYLLRTPVDNPRVTSGFGLRFHPLLGYTRMHQGVDFGAPVGTPVIAAADGEVEQVRWAGGYGRFIRLRHAGGWETGYGHLSAWATGLAAGGSVRQGQVIGYVGATGLATGPHLHYEVYRSGVAVNPSEAQPVTSDLPVASPAFVAEKRAVSDLLARLSAAARIAELPAPNPLAFAGASARGLR